MYVVPWWVATYTHDGSCDETRFASNFFAPSHSSCSGHRGIEFDASYLACIPDTSMCIYSE